MYSDLSRFPRVTLLGGPTPVQELTRLNEGLGGVRIFVKRDDVTPVGGGGNKLRKLEFLLGAAKAQGADTVVTVGALQSNHARLTAAASARFGFSCELVLPRVVDRTDADYVNNGNVLLDELFGATVHDLPRDADVTAFVAMRIDALTKEGRNVYFAPVGGSNAVGCLGYAACAWEIEAQARVLGVEFSHVIVANGSSGTHAGLAAGFALAPTGADHVKSYAVYYAAEKTRAITLAIANDVLAELSPGHTLGESDIVVDGNHRGDGYGIPTQGMLDAVRLVARTEGLLLDPVYSGKAFAGLVHDIRSGTYKPGDCVLFIMTGGTPGLFAYRSALTG
ncbi:MAG: D-cysteine desulfhydrase family protein [Rhizomicrobium sp.]